VNIGFKPAPYSRSGTRPLPAPLVPPRSRTLCALCVSVFSCPSFFPRRSACTVGSVPAPPFPSCFALPLSCKRSQELTPLFSQASALLKKEHFANSFAISCFRTLLQNAAGVPTPFFSFLWLLTTHNSLFTNSFRICTFEKYDSNPFGIRSFKTHDLKPIRMCSYEKTPKQDRPAQSLPLFSTPSKHAACSNANNSIPFMRLLHNSRTPRG